MTLVVRAVFWVMAYLGVILAPLVFAAIGGSQPDCRKGRVLERLTSWRGALLLNLRVMSPAAVK